MIDDYSKGYKDRDAEVLSCIEKLIGENIQCIRDTRLTDEQKEYYKIKLDALYELNRLLF